MKLVRTPVDQNLFVWQVEKVTIPTEDGYFSILRNHTNMIAVLKKWHVSFLPVHTIHSALDEFRDHTVNILIEWWLCKVVDNEIILTVSALW